SAMRVPFPGRSPLFKLERRITRYYIAFVERGRRGCARRDNQGRRPDPMSSEDLHVPRDVLTQESRLLHYAITSLKEELDAVDWYRQRADDCEDEDLKKLLLHNMREEMEHAAMLIEWLRRRNADFAGHIK